jgi:hypothetical protein
LGASILARSAEARQSAAWDVQAAVHTPGATGRRIPAEAPEAGWDVPAASCLRGASDGGSVGRSTEVPDALWEAQVVASRWSASAGPSLSQAAEGRDAAAGGRDSA